MHEVAAVRAEGLANVDLRRGQLDALPLPDAAIDVALCQLVLHHVAALPPVFAELRRGLVTRELPRATGRPGGARAGVVRGRGDGRRDAGAMTHRSDAIATNISTADYLSATINA